LRPRVPGPARAAARDRAPARRRLRGAAGGNGAPARARHGLRGYDPGRRPQDPLEPLRAGARGGRDRGRANSRDRRVLPPAHTGDRGYAARPARTLAAAHVLGPRPHRPRDAHGATRRGRTVKATSVGGFLLLYTLARLKPLRRRSLRFATEQAALADWLGLVAQVARSDYALALQVARMRGLVKGYGDTHARGRMKFEKLSALLPQLRRRSDAPALLAGLIKAALADETGEALDKAIADLAATEGRSPSRAAS